MSGLERGLPGIGDDFSDVDSVVCFDDMDSDGNRIRSDDIIPSTKLSCETNEIVLEWRDKVNWANKIVNEGLNKLVFGSFLDRDFIGWSGISNFYSNLGNKNGKNTDKVDGIIGRDLMTNDS